MEGEAGLARNSNKKLNHDKRRARQRAKRRANREEPLEEKRNKGTGILDTTPCIAVLNMITRGRYLKVGKGFIIRRKIKEIKEVGV